MINESSLSKEWIEELRSAELYKKAHPELMEKILEEIIASSSFTSFKCDENRTFADGFPKAHYDIFYISKFDGAENNILLDVVFDEIPYPEIIEAPIKSVLLNTSEPDTTTKVPSINSLTGDKLTAFAPNTIGIKYNSNKDLQIIKQLFDLGRLFHVADDFNVVADSFNRIAATQLDYQKKDFSMDEILLDTINTSYLLAMQNKNKDDALLKYEELHSGVKKIPPFLPEPKYSMYNAIEDSAKAAFIAAKLLMNDYTHIEKIDKKDYDPNEFHITDGKYKAVTKMIKGMPNISLYYWHQVSMLIN